MKSAMLSRRLVFAAMLPFLLPPSGILASNETIDVDSWIYPAFRTLELSGLVDLPSRMPWTRGEAEFFLERALQSLGDGGAPLTARRSFILDRLKAEFLGKASRPMNREDGPLWCLKEGARFATFDLSAGASYGKSAPEDRTGAAGSAVPEFLADLGRGLTLVSSYSARIERESGSNVSGEKPSPREKSFRGLRSEYRRGYLSVTGGRWAILAGRDHIHWGPGRVEGLIMSRTAGSIDQLSATVELGRFRLSAVQAVLDPEIPRRLAGHRLEISLPRKVRLGISETVVYTGRSLDFSYLIPVGSFYANQYNERDDDNILWGADLKVPLRRGLIAHGEILVDDFQYEDRGTAPDRLAFSVAIDALAAPFGRDVEITAGYARVDIYTYAHKDSLLTRYVAGNGDPLVNPILGSTLGPDSDRWNLGIRLSVTARLTTEAGVTLTRRGDGNDLREWEWGSDPDPDFPSGATVEERTFLLGGSFDLGGGSSVFGKACLVRASGPGSDGDGSYAYLGMILDF